jgi:C-terminal processing protease CtpA/Prc
VKLLKYFLFVIVFFSCKKDIINPHTIDFNKIFNRIKENHIYKDSLNWNDIKSKSISAVGKIRSIKDKYKALELTLKLTKDKHSFFLYPIYDSIEKKHTSPFIYKDKKTPKLKCSIINKKIAYLKIEGFLGNDSLNIKYSKRINNKIDSLKSFNKWIIDLRKNKGGKKEMFPLGFNYFLNNSIIGYSKDNDNNLIVYKILEGVYYDGTKKLDSLISNRKRVGKNQLAILVGENTASASEFLAYTLRKNNNAKLFGSKTTGLLTDINVYSFSSGASFGFSTTTMCDSLGNPIEGIYPDFKCKQNETIKLATKWLTEHN